MAFRDLASRWQIFWYNFGWSDWVAYIDGWIPRFALFVPVIGYLILFNDSVGTVLVFEYLAEERITQFGLSGQERLRFVYFGLFALGISNLIFRFKKPYVFTFGTNRSDYMRTCLEVFTFQDFLQLHGTIRHRGHLTLDGKYYDSEWDGFVEAATNTGEGTDRVERDGSWDEARGRYGSLLRSILGETFFRGNTQRRFWLLLCVALSTLGYILLSMPSVDLFIKVVLSSSGL
jgi:hypothetical protein